jgi:nitroreductase
MSQFDIDSLIRSRRAVFPQMYSGEPIHAREIHQMLENANWAPTHKKTEPWRFIVFHSEDARRELGRWLGGKYRMHATHAGDYSVAKEEKFNIRPVQSGCVLGICMQRDPGERLPEWEEIAALACAVQNIWLTCTAYGIGAYWSTPGFVVGASDFPRLGDGWQCRGVFYMGRWTQQELPSIRTPVQDKVIWAD